MLASFALFAKRSTRSPADSTEFAKAIAPAIIAVIASNTTPTQPQAICAVKPAAAVSNPSAFTRDFTVLIATPSNIKAVPTPVIVFAALLAPILSRSLPTIISKPPTDIIVVDIVDKPWLKACICCSAFIKFISA